MRLHATTNSAMPPESLQFTQAGPVLFQPVYKERVWGGHRLKSWFSVQTSAPVGEYWLLSAHPSGMSVVKDGRFKGMTLQELVERFPEAYLGRSPQPRFPLLIKLIEAAEHLSVQVHPDDAYALKMEGDYGKTEAWYVLEADDGAEVIHGHRFENRDHLMRSVKEKSIGNYLGRTRIQKDDLVYVPSGTLHALLKNTVVLEIQQTSDVTYRVYDWDRVDMSGKSRELHIEQAADVIRYKPQADPVICIPERMERVRSGLHERLLVCPYFTIERIGLSAGGVCVLQHGRVGNPDVLIVLEGEGRLECGDAHEALSFQKGDIMLVPAGLPGYRVHAAGRVKCLRTYY